MPRGKGLGLSCAACASRGRCTGAVCACKLLLRARAPLGACTARTRGPPCRPPPPPPQTLRSAPPCHTSVEATPPRPHLHRTRARGVKTTASERVSVPRVPQAWPDRSTERVPAAPWRQGRGLAAALTSLALARLVARRVHVTVQVGALAALSPRLAPRTPAHRRQAPCGPHDCFSAAPQGQRR